MLSYIGKISHNSKSNVTAQFKKNVNNYLNGSYLETSGGQSSNLYLNVFSTPVLIRHLRRLKTVFSGEGGGTRRHANWSTGLWFQSTRRLACLIVDERSVDKFPLPPHLFSCIGV